MVLISLHTAKVPQPFEMILNEEQADWIEAGNPDAPIDWQLALDIWRGQRLLANFNSFEQFE